MIRFEILLPLYYNDGRTIEDQKFIETDDELVAVFGATTTEAVVVRGHWLYQSTVYEDRLIRVRVDVEDTSGRILRAGSLCFNKTPDPFESSSPKHCLAAYCQ